jgi:hypothetical protein
MWPDHNVTGSLTVRGSRSQTALTPKMARRAAGQDGNLGRTPRFDESPSITIPQHLSLTAMAVKMCHNPRLIRPNNGTTNGRNT